MGAEILKDFLARIGFQVDEAGAQKFQKSLATASLRAAAFGATIQAAAASLYYSLYKMAEGQSQMLALSEATGVAVGKLEELDYIAGQTDATAEGLHSSLKGLQAAMAGTTIGQGGLSTFHRLGIRAKDANGHLRDTADVLFEVGQKIKNMDRGKQEMFLSQLGIDRSLVKMLTSDVSGLSAAYREMYAAAGTDAQQAAEASRAYVNEIKSIKTVFGMLAQSVAMAFVGKAQGSLQNLRKGVMDNFGKISRVIQTIISVVTRVASAIGVLAVRVMKWIGGVVDWFGQLDDGTQDAILALGGLVAAWKFLNLSFMATPLGIILSLAAALVLLFDDFQTWKEGGESFIDWSKWEPGISAALDFLGRLKVTFGLVAGALVAWKVIPGVIGGVSSALSTMRAVMTAMASTNPLMLVAMGLVVAAGLIIDNWETVKKWFTSFVDWLGNKFSWVADVAKSIGNLFSGGETSMQDMVDGMFGTGDVTRPATPVLGPTPVLAAAAAGTTSTPVFNANTTINVDGSASPEATAQAVFRGQKGVNADLVRHGRGAAR